MASAFPHRRRIILILLALVAIAGLLGAGYYGLPKASADDSPQNVLPRCPTLEPYKPVPLNQALPPTLSDPPFNPFATLEPYKPVPLNQALPPTPKGCTDIPDDPVPPPPINN